MTIINRQTWYFEPGGDKARLDILGTAEELPDGDVVTIKGVTYHLMDGSCFRAVDTVVEYRLYHGGWLPQAEKGEFYNFMVDAIEGVESLTIPDGITSIGSRAFASNSNLTSITIPDSVTSIGNNAFANCTRLTSIVIQDGVTSIGNNAFSSCSNLTSVTIPGSVKNIGSQAFYLCSGLTSIIINKPESSISGAPWGAPSTTQIIWKSSTGTEEF